MKKLLFTFFIMLTCMSYGQGLTKKDFVLEDSKYLLKKTIILKNGEGKDSKVELLLSMPEIAFKELGEDNVGFVNMMLDFTNDTAKENLKNKYSYIPRESNLMYEAENKRFSVSIEFTGTNSYGGQVQNRMVAYFEKDGKYVGKYFF